MKVFNHPQEVCMNYTQHLKLSINLSFLMLKGSIKAVIHAFIPDLCVTSTTDIHQEIGDILLKNGCHKQNKDIETNPNKED